MAPNPNLHPGLTLLLVLIAVAATPSLALHLPGNSSTVYETLPEYGLPSGLLPSTVTDFTISDDGRFVVHLDDKCYVQFDYLVYYDTTITGKLSYGSIKELKGIQVQRFFLWLDVGEIKVDLPPSDSIYFQVGIINKKLDISQFKTVRSCRDSLSCGPTWKWIFERPTSLDETQMLLTE